MKDNMRRADASLPNGARYYHNDLGALAPAQQLGVIGSTRGRLEEDGTYGIRLFRSRDSGWAKGVQEQFVTSMDS